MTIHGYETKHRDLTFSFSLSLCFYSCFLIYFVLQHMILWVLKLLGLMGLFWSPIVQDLAYVLISRDCKNMFYMEL